MSLANQTPTRTLIHSKRGPDEPMTTIDASKNPFLLWVGREQVWIVGHVVTS